MDPKVSGSSNTSHSSNSTGGGQDNRDINKTWKGVLSQLQPSRSVSFCRHMDYWRSIGTDLHKKETPNQNPCNVSIFLNYLTESSCQTKAKQSSLALPCPPPYHGPNLLKWHSIYLIVADMSPLHFKFIQNDYWCAQKQLHRKRLAKCWSLCDSLNWIS